MIFLYQGHTFNLQKTDKLEIHDTNLQKTDNTRHRQQIRFVPLVRDLFSSRNRLRQLEIGESLRFQGFLVSTNSDRGCRILTLHLKGRFYPDFFPASRLRFG